MPKRLRYGAFLAVSAARSRWGVRLALAVLVLVVCAASYSGFYDKWSLRDDDSRFSSVAMTEGTARRPFVYRRLLPETAVLLESLTPKRIQAVLVQNYVDSKRLRQSRDATDPRTSFRYVATYFLGFVGMLGAAGALYALVRSRSSAAAAVASACAIVLFYPILQSNGGYVYDFSELAFLSLAVLAAGSRRVWLLVPLAVAASYNKESFFFFIPSLFPFVAARHKPVTAAAWLSAAGAASLGVYALVRRHYTHNPGGAFDVHVAENVFWYLNPLNLASHEWTYGLPLFSGFSVVTLGLLWVLIANGWAGLRRADQRHLLIASAINAPLMMALGMHGEMRNLSLAFPGFALLGGAAFDRMLARQPRDGARRSDAEPAGFAAMAGRRRA